MYHAFERNTRGRAHSWAVTALLALMALLPSPLVGGDLESKLAELRARGELESWTFTVGQTSVSHIPLEQLCGLIVPEDWDGGGSSPSNLGASPLGLPAGFDWRDLGGCTPIRDQGVCGACWAFATIAPLESNILIHDGVSVDLSEQWLVSCNREGWGCNGGFWAHDYLMSATDTCGGSGAVLEEQFPYVASDVACACPYGHPYLISSWSCISGSEFTTPSVEEIKQAIYQYGPVSCAVYADDAFQNYTGGVFNACATGQSNHAVVLVGWDDDQGTSGVWILRNSWGTGWGESGYMRIEYGCSNVGEGAAYVVYTGQATGTIEVTPTTLDLGSVAVGDSATAILTVRNVGDVWVNGSATGLGAPFSFVDSAAYQLDPGELQTITVRFAPSLGGTFVDGVIFTAGTPVAVTVTGTGLAGAPADACTAAPLVSDGTFSGSNVYASTDGSSSCGGTGDIWWRFQAPTTGVTTFDTCGSDFDTVLSVHSGCAGMELGCNNNYSGCLVNGAGSLVTLNVVSGVRYHVRVAGNQGATGNVVLNISTRWPTQTISGRITTSDGLPVPGVTLSGLPGDPVTDSYGQYTATVDRGFTGVAVPTYGSVGFDPVCRSYVDVFADHTDQDYTADIDTFRISGTITDADGNPLAGVSLSGFPYSCVTGPSGTYMAKVLAGFTGTITPSMQSTNFTPANRFYTNVNADLADQDYQGLQRTGSLVVYLGPEEAVAGGAKWRVDGGAWRNGGQTVAGLLVGQHTVDYAPVTGWTAPLPETVQILENQTIRGDREYVQHYYTLALTARLEGYGTIAADPAPDADGYYLQDTAVALTAAPAPGYRVRAWHWADLTPAAGYTTNSVTMTGNRTVLVEFEPEPFHPAILTASVIGDGGSIEPQRGAYRGNEVVTLIATPDDGYQVKAWSGTDDDASADTTNTVTMTSSKAVTVEFEPWSDCNNDGVSDRLNIAAGTSADCNGNGIPDECELWELDLDGNGVIDECENAPAGHQATPAANASTDEAADGATVVTMPSAGFCGLGIIETMAFTLVGMGLLRGRGGRLRQG